MLNSGYKKEALKKCEEAMNVYKEQYDNAINKSIELHNKKEEAIGILKSVDEFIHSLSNKPKKIVKVATEITVRRKEFEEEVEALKIECMEADKAGKGVAGAGALAGAGVAAFGPTVAMGIATTFGTASTGTAIATLAGAAQTNAALAWLGGGSLAASGGGMSAGSAFLAMAGPVGWAIGGAALLSGGLLASSRNKKAAEKAEQQTLEIKNETNNIRKVKAKILAEIKAVVSLNEGVFESLETLKKTEKNDYKKFTENEKDTLMQLMNAAEALSKRIGEKIV